MSKKISIFETQKREYFLKVINIRMNTYVYYLWHRGAIYRRSLWINYKERESRRAWLSTPRNLYEPRNAISCKLDPLTVSQPLLPRVVRFVFRHMYNKVSPSRDTYIKNTAGIGRIVQYLLLFSPRSTRAPARPRGISAKKGTSPFRIFRVWVFVRPLVPCFVNTIFYISLAQSVSLLRPCVGSWITFFVA